jgi:acetyl-CoA carboxylase biotin carboxyl carrier protein
MTRSGTRPPADMSPLESEMSTLAAQDAMEILGRSLAEVVRAAPLVPSRARVRFGCASIEVEWPQAETGGPASPPAPDPVDTADGLREVCAPLVGTFYRAREPGARPFVEIGDEIEAGQQVAIVEAMKLMNPIVAEDAGRVVEILVGDGDPVEYGQSLFRLEQRAEE